MLRGSCARLAACPTYIAIQIELDRPVKRRQIARCSATFCRCAMLQTTPSLSRNVGKASRAVYGKIAGTAIRLAERASRNTFGNVAGLRSNLDGAMEEARLRFRRRYPTDAAKTLRSVGYQALSPVDRGVMERIRSAYASMIDDETMSRPNGHTGALRQGLCFSRIV